ncbi:MAG: AsnC family transcriptional regulator [Desulfovibrionaceae bacterium]|nr:AsnC family transcriptional regulator [Desulfovibrionaceae bacterium]
MSESKLDKINLEIVRLLQNGRLSFREVGRVLGISEATVRSRVARMIEQGLVEIKALISTKDLGAGYFTAYIGVRLKSPALKKTAEQISELPGVISVAVVTGRYDLILTVMLTPDLGLMDFFNNMLEKYSDSISANETFMIYESVNLKTPYPF